MTKRIHQWWHCLTKLHRPLTLRAPGGQRVFACADCDFMVWKFKEPQP